MEGEHAGTVKASRTKIPKKTKVERSKTFKDRVKEKERERERETGVGKERERAGAGGGGGGGGGGTVGTGGGGGGMGGEEIPEVNRVTEQQVR